MNSFYLYTLFTVIATAVIARINPHNGCKERLIKNSYTAACINKTDFRGLSYLHSETATLLLINNDFKVLTGAPFRSLSKLTLLSISTSTVEVLKNDAFVGLRRLEELYLGYNEIKTIEDDIFTSCPLLISIDFSYNRLTTLTFAAKAMAPLMLLRIVTFEGNALEALAEDDFKPMHKSPLTTLSLTKCSLMRLGRRVFSHLHYLSNLYLSANSLSDPYLADGLHNVSSDLRTLEITNMSFFSIPSNALAALSKTTITSLKLDNSERISYITDNSFPPMTTLHFLSLQNCQVEFISPLGFKNLTSLEAIDLSNNKLKNIPDAILSATTLKTLVMNNNVDHKYPNIKFEIGERRMTEMINLEVLTLVNVNIQFLSRYALYGLQNLKMLYLTKSLNKIEEYAFETLIHLEKLNLALCHIQIIHSNIFKGLGNLSYLDLQNTFVNFDPTVQYFHDLPNLKTLVLGSNKLNSLPRKDISNLKKLEMLSVGKNSIPPWNEPFLFGKNLNLQRFDLKMNNLNEITPAMIKDFSVVTTIDISNNPFNCSKCTMHDFAKFLNATNTTNPYIENMKHTTCSSPKNLVDLNLAFVPFYDYCAIDYLPKILAISISLSIVLALSITSGIVGYHYRWYFRYYWFLTRSRVKRMKFESASDSFLYDAFISYNSNDQLWLVENLLPKLEAEEPRFKTCLHGRDFEIGKEIMLNVVESIQNSRFIVLLLSKNFLTSQWCTWEMNMAQFMSVDDGRNALILIMLEPINKKNMSATLKYLVKTRTYLEWPDNVQGQKLFWERLKFAMRKPVYGNDQPQLI